MTLMIRLLSTAGLAGTILVAPAMAQDNLLKAVQQTPKPAPTPSQTATKPAATTPKKASAPAPASTPQPKQTVKEGQETAPVAVDANQEFNNQATTPATDAAAVRDWSPALATKLLEAINAAGAMGLNPADYMPGALQQALTTRDNAAISAAANASFRKLALAVRDGATPKEARVQWFVRDTDAKKTPYADILNSAVDGGDIAAVLTSLEPLSPDYTALKAELAKTDPKETQKIRLIRTNLERWRWLPRDLGQRYIFVNVPEYTAQLADSGKLLRTHRVIVGKSDTPTPQLDALAQGVILNPVWNLPQSIVEEGVGALIRRNPAAAKARGYTWTKSGDKLYVQQKASLDNSLGMMKIDMPNDYAIFLHDTPAKGLFSTDRRAYSHGCIRTDRAVEFAAFMAIFYGGKTPEELKEVIYSGKTTKFAFPEKIPVYINYFTARVEDGAFKSFPDLYGRDRPVMTAMGYSVTAPAKKAEGDKKPAGPAKPAAKKKAAG